MENVRNRLRLEFIEKYEFSKIIKQQSKLTFAGIHKSYENCDSYLFKKIEVLMNKQTYLGFAVLELGKLHINETNYDKLKPYFGEENIQLHYIDTDAVVLSMKTKVIIKDLKDLEDIFNFSNLDENHELISNKNRKVISKFKLETPKNTWIDELVCLRSKKYSFKFGDDSKNKFKGISKSQSKHNKFEEYKKCVGGEEYRRECNNCILRSINYELFLQEVKKSTFSLFDDKRCYINETKSIPWK